MDEFCRDCSARDAFFIECGSGAQIGNPAQKVEELACKFEISLVRHEIDESARLNIGVSASQRSPRIIKRRGFIKA
ncbi:hypothetical protein [Peribacillus loiseleuriae]|uniref:hypothetical protein n=1 Tax=Peribacillus loiseleuriae TaxID=1679170 RepID=UPI0012E0EDF4|nr:hypothetical protein [Peribacillus loiseleuriae]